MGTGGSFPGDKATGAWSYTSTPHTSPWRSALLSTGTVLLLTDLYLIM
jgi:hypothetical protein